MIIGVPSESRLHVWDRITDASDITRLDSELGSFDVDVSSPRSKVSG